MASVAKYALSSALGFALAACGMVPSEAEIAAAQQGAEAAVDRFHMQYNAGDYGATWDETHVDFKEETTRDDWIAFVQGMEPAGPVLDSQLETVDTRHHAGQPVISMTYLTQFELTLARETYEFVGSADDIAMRMYEIKAPVEDTR